MTSPRHRELLCLRGTRDATADEARRCVAALDPDRVLWVSSDTTEFSGAIKPRAVRKLLGGSFDAVVLDLHDGLDADVVGQSHGFVWGGGAMVFRIPLRGQFPVANKGRLAAYPFGPADVGDRYWARFESIVTPVASASHEIAPPPHAPDGTSDQASVAQRMAELFVEASASRIVLLADRGRGKSAALGLAIADGMGRAELDVAVSAARPEAAAEVFRFALGAADPPSEGPVRFVPLMQLLAADESPDVIVVDEAAQLPVGALRELVQRHARSTLAFATTTHGYEGTGRGFGIRFLEWLRDRQPVYEFELREPIRWGEGDALEPAIFDALLLDAELEPLHDGIDATDARHVVFDRDELVRDEGLLRSFFGLLVQAHYRTTPSDIHRMLDAPNLDLHALLVDDLVVAASVVAREGAWDVDLCSSVYEGEQRVLGHALPETLVAHLGHREMGALEMVRSVRIAVHPRLRRSMLGSRLVEAVERSYEPALFGTLFGATPELLRFRRGLGYHVVRLSASRGARTGVPSVTMVKAARPETEPMVRSLREEFARDLPAQLALMRRAHELADFDRLEAALSENLLPAAPLDRSAVDDGVRHYVDGPRTFESVAAPIAAYVERHRDVLDELDSKHRVLIEARALEHEPWAQAAARAGLGSVPAAMRALRRAMRELVTRVADRG